MKGEDVCYPAFLLGGSDSKPMAFSGPGALFISGRFRAPAGPMKEDTLQMADLNEAALRADTEVDEQVRQYFLEGWGRHREKLVAAETFQGVAEAMGPLSLYTDNWFSGRGRSNRAEYLAVVVSAIVMIGTAGLVGSLIASTIWSVADFVLGIVAAWLIGAAAVRRCHDFGRRFYPFVILWLALAVVEQGISQYLHFEGGWLSAAVLVLLILALAIPPGTSGENQYDPQPNPGPSL